MPSERTLDRRTLLSAAGLLGLVTACGGGISTSATKGTINFYNDNAPWVAGFEHVNPALKKTTGYALNPLTVPTTTSYEQVVKSQLQTSKTPDLFKWWNGYRLQDIARTGKIADLTETWDRAENDGILYGELREPFSYEDKVYGFPLSQSYYVCFYNKRIFAKHDLEAPTTWDDFMSAAKTLKDNDVTPFIASQTGTWPSLIWFEDMVSRTSPQLYEDLTQGRASYTDSLTRQAFGRWQELIENDYFTPPDIDLANAPALLKDGSAAIYLAATWSNGTIQATGLKPGVDYSAFIMPPVDADTEPSIVTEAGALVIPDEAPRKDVAIEVVRGWLDLRVQRSWSSWLQDLSPNPQLVSPDPVIKEVLDQVDRIKPRVLTRFWEASPPALVEGNVQDLANFMIHPEDMDSVLEGMADRADSEWEYWKEGV